MKTNIHFWSYPAQFLEWETFQAKPYENQNIHFVFNNFFSKIVPFNLEKCSRAGEATDDNMVHAHCMLEH
jgi:hypothetical protein